MLLVVKLMYMYTGIVHGENFPLVNTESHNHLRLFQIWLNLPAKSKMVEPCYVMVSFIYL